MELFESNWKGFLNEQVQFSPEIERFGQVMASDILELVSDSAPVRQDIVNMVDESPEQFFDMKDEDDYDEDSGWINMFTDYIDGEEYVDDPEDFINIYLPALLDKDVKSFFGLMRLVMAKFIEQNEEIRDMFFELFLDVYDLDPDTDDKDKIETYLIPSFDSLASAIADALTNKFS